MIDNEGGINIYNFNKWWYFLLFCLLILLITYFSKTFLIKNELFYEAWGDQLSVDRIEELLKSQEEWEWVTYVFIPLFYLAKFFLISSCLAIGIFVSGLEVNFNSLFKITMISEIIFLIPLLTNLVWFSFIRTDYSLIDIESFYPLSLQSLFKNGEVEPWLIYPLKVLNLFEIIYILLLAYGIKVIYHKNLQESLTLVLSSYGIGLTLWIVFIIFLSVNLL